MEPVRDSQIIYEQMAEEQLIQGRIAELMYERELSIAVNNGLKMCPSCKSIHGNLDSDRCSMCCLDFGMV